MTKLTVVCVDPDKGARTATADALADAGHTVVSCASLADATDRIDGSETTTEVDCVVTEYDFPEGTGLDLAARVRKQAPDTPCILFTSEGPDRIETERHEGVVVEYLPKDTPEARSLLVRLVGNSVAQRSQAGYPLPSDEDERLATLAQYDRPGLGTAESFDRLTELAQTHFGVDVAFVGLVDAHEERFLACSGANWETLAREDSMCTHTILEEELFVVEDVNDDPRFAENERLAELDIDAYVGVPLKTPEGAAIGAFCLTNDEPQTFSEAEIADLRRFADETMEQLELRHRLAERDKPADTRPNDGTPPESGGPMGGDRR